MLLSKNINIYSPCFVSSSLSAEMIDVIGYNSDSDRSSMDLNNGSDVGSSKDLNMQHF